MVGGRCFLHPQGGVVELFSSEVYSFVLEELGCGRLSDSARWRRLEGAETTLEEGALGLCAINEVLLILTIFSDHFLQVIVIFKQFSSQLQPLWSMLLKLQF